MKHNEIVGFTVLFLLIVAIVLCVFAASAPVT